MANSTASRCRHGPSRRITSVLKRPMIDSASALSYESPRLPTDGAMPASARSIGVAHRQVLRPAIAVMHEPVRGFAAPVVNRLLERVEHEVGRQRRRDAPADDAAGEDVNHERDVDEAPPRCDVREIRHPELVRPRRGEIPIDEIERPLRLGPGCVVVVHARPRTAPASPISRIKRRTRQRASRKPSRPICFQTFRGP